MVELSIIPAIEVLLEIELFSTKIEAPGIGDLSLSSCIIPVIVRVSCEYPAMARNSSKACKIFFMFLELGLY
jgi:hypothetical protein